jgi:uncharacterized protein YqfB (UPF0267 family)
MVVCSTIGGVEIPFYELTEGSESGYKVIMEFDNSKSKYIPADINRVGRRRLADEKKRALERGKDYPNGWLVGIHDYTVDEEKKTITLKASRTTYFRHLKTNLSLEEKLDSGQTIREKNGDDPSNLDDLLANPLGVGAVTITSDDYMIVVVRSRNSDTAPSGFGVSPAGYMRRYKDFTNNKKDLVNRRPDPHITLCREGLEEICVGEDEVKKVVFTGFGRSKKTLHADLYGILYASLKKDVIIERITEAKKKKGKASYKTSGDVGVHENEDLIFIKLEPNIEHVISSNEVFSRMGEFLASHAAAVLNALICKYGKDKVEECFNSIKG